MKPINETDIFVGGGGRDRYAEEEEMKSMKGLVGWTKGPGKIVSDGGGGMVDAGKDKTGQEIVRSPSYN